MEEKLFLHIFVIFNLKNNKKIHVSKEESETVLNSAHRLPNSSTVKSARSLPSSNVISVPEAKMENCYFSNLKITKICRNSISSITFDIELRF